MSGSGAALADHDAQSDAAEIDAAARRDLAGLLHLRHQRRGDDDEVGGLAGRDGVAQLPVGPTVKIEFVAGLPCE